MKRLLLVLIVLLLCVGAVGCTPAENLNDTENHSDAVPDATSAPQKTTKTYQDWLAVLGTQIELPDLNQPASPEEWSGGDNPHFCGEVVEVTVDYLVVKPDVTLIDTRYDHMVPYTEELLKHAQRYIVPLATGGNGAYAADEFAVGDQVCVRFNHLQVYRVAAYDPSLVLRIVFSCSLLQSE
jgi:hypothetical protein